MFRLDVKACFMNLLGGLILAFGIYNIHSISGVTEGGVLGAMLLLEHWFHISPAISGLVLNGVCYFIGWKNLGRDFIGYSIIAGGGFSLFYAIFEKFPRLFPQIADYPLIAALAGAVFIGVGAGIAVRFGGAPSGDDALAMSLSDIFKCRINIIYLISDITVLALSLSYIPLRTILYSLLTVILSGVIIDLIHRTKTKKPQKEALSEPRNVLVATLRNAEQLEACINHRFYHIPEKRLCDGDFPVRYVAIYQSKNKFGSDAGVRYFGEVSDVALVPRCEITEIPKSSTELYYRFSIKEWKTLETSISATENDFVNMMTSLSILTNSAETSELFFFDSDKLTLHKKIKSAIQQKEHACISLSGGFSVTLFSDNIALKKDDVILFLCTHGEYLKSPVATLERILGRMKNI